MSTPLRTWREKREALRESEAWHREQEQKRLMVFLFFAVMLALIVIAGPECGHGC